jgi:phage tail-like protein
MSLIFERPPSGFHFAVIFELFPQGPSDFRFQEVGGLNITVETEEFKEGGENRFSHKLPKRTSFSPLELKRGLFTGSRITMWCKDAIENFNFEPVNITIMLLNEYHIPVAGWYVVNAYPIEWSTSGFNSTSSDLVVESLKLNYSYFNTIRI